VKAAARCLIVALTICSWIAISNHCALRAITTTTGATQNVCPFHSKPTKPQPQPGGTECCKILRAVSTTPAKILAPAIVDLVCVDLAFDTLAVFPPPKISFTPATLDTGPPGRTSFVELIGSMRAHAPPFVV
jgi:hypothetical protein